MCNTTNIIAKCNLVTNISRGHHHTVIVHVHQRDNTTQKVNGIISWKYFASFHEKCVVDGIGGRAKKIVWRKFMSKNNDVIVQSPHDFATRDTVDASHNSAACVAN